MGNLTNAASGEASMSPHTAGYEVTIEGRVFSLSKPDWGRVMSKPTPGPWHVGGVVGARYLAGIGDVVLIRRDTPRDDRYVAMASLDAMGDGRDLRTTDAERDANARLIAAAPELLAALDRLCADLECGEHLSCSIRDDDLRSARAAIAKATQS